MTDSKLATAIRKWLSDPFLAHSIKISSSQTGDRKIWTCVMLLDVGEYRGEICIGEEEDFELCVIEAIQKALDKQK